MCSEKEFPAPVVARIAKQQRGGNAARRGGHGAHTETSLGRSAADDAWACNLLRHVLFISRPLKGGATQERRCHAAITCSYSGHTLRSSAGINPHDAGAKTGAPRTSLGRSAAVTPKAEYSWRSTSQSRLMTGGVRAAEGGHQAVD